MPETLNKISLIRLLRAVCKPSPGLAAAKHAVENPDKAYTYVTLHGNLDNFHEKWEPSEIDEMEAKIKRYLRHNRPASNQINFNDLMQVLAESGEMSTLAALMRLWQLGRYSRDSVIYY